MAEAVSVNGSPGADRTPITGRELGRLLAHDCRTPLHAIRGFAELALSGAAGPLSAEALEYLRQISKSGRALEEALVLAQELVDLEVDGPSRRGRPIDLAYLLRTLGFVRTGDGADRPLPRVRGNPAVWLRVGRACRSYLEGIDGDQIMLTAQTRTVDDRALELVLHRADLTHDRYAGVLILDLARRCAAREGCRLRLLDRDTIGLAWPTELIVAGR